MRSSSKSRLEANVLFKSGADVDVVIDGMLCETAIDNDAEDGMVVGECLRPKDS